MRGMMPLGGNGDEVVFRPLGTVARIRNGRDYKALGSGHVPVFGSGGVIAFVDTAAYEKPSVLIPRKGSLGNLFYVDTPFWTVDTIFYTEIDESVMHPKFLYYFLTTQRLEELNQAGGVPSLTQAILNEVRVPAPPLEAQVRIAEILDTFTGLGSELGAELEARRRQYAHYQSALLEFSEQVGVRWATLGELAEIGTGSRNSNEALAAGPYPFFVRSQEVRYLDSYEFDETAVITSGDGVGVGKVFHYVEGKYALHQRAYRVRVSSPDLVAKFLFYYMRNSFLEYMQKAAVRSSVTSVRRPMLVRYPVPLPSLDEQQRIVTVLDKFDAFVNDPVIGLPAEARARRQQYEHYRDRLLTFGQAAA